MGARVSAPQVARSQRARRQPSPMRRRQRTGSAHSVTVTGSPSTMSGAAIIISSRCCVMCTEKSAAPIASTGETSAMNSERSPA